MVDDLSLSGEDAKLIAAAIRVQIAKLKRQVEAGAPAVGDAAGGMSPYADAGIGSPDAAGSESGMLGASSDNPCSDSVSSIRQDGSEGRRSFDSGGSPMSGMGGSGGSPMYGIVEEGSERGVGGEIYSSPERGMGRTDSANMCMSPSGGDGGPGGMSRKRSSNGMLVPPEEEDRDLPLKKLLQVPKETLGSPEF